MDSTFLALATEHAAAAQPPQPPAPAAAPAEPASTSELVHASNLSTGVLVLLVMSWSLAGHHLASRSRYLTEGSAACALGLITGVVLLLFHRFLSWQVVTQLLEFNAAGFFTYLLPPVIFYCGLSVERQRFFQALPSILCFGVLGTLCSFLIISLFLYVAFGFALFKLADCLAMGAIFAATDSVATLQVLNPDALPGLFSLVFGEGVVNDAVSVVLLGAVANAAKAHASGGLAGGVVLNFFYLLATSLLLGGAAGLGIAWALKSLRLNGPHQELSVITLLSYLSYLLADVAGLSAILSLFVCGVVVSHYALHNVSPDGRLATMTSFKTASYLSEGIIFIYVGMDSLDPLKWRGANAVEAVWLVLVLTALLVVARAAFVIPLSLLHNMWSAEKLGSREIVVIWWAGLMRGAVSVAMCYLYFDDNSSLMSQDRARATLIVATLTVVMISILGGGALTKPLLAAMLKDTDAPIMEQLRTIPLLSNLARDSSNNNLIDRFESALRGQRHSGSRGNTPRSFFGSGGSLTAQGGANDRSRSSRPGFAGFDVADAAVDFAEGEPLVPPGQRQQGPAAVQVDAFDAFTHSTGQQDHQQQQRGGLVQRSPSSVLVELQQQGAPAAASNNTVMTTMQQVGHVWGVFDRSYMQPMFGGPAPAAAPSSSSAAGSRAPPGVSHQQQQ